MKKKIADFLTIVRIWIQWEVITTYQKEYRCGNIQFLPRLYRIILSREVIPVYDYSISEAEYLYDEPAAILRSYRNHVVKSERARRDIRK